MLNIACLIPFYNEGQSLLETIKVASKVPEFTEIIAINDGSTNPETSEVMKQIAKEFPQVKLLDKKRNVGKAAAIKAGLQQVITDWVFLLDADLKKLTIKELSKAINLVDKHADQVDLLILRRSPEDKFVRAIRHDILMSGERIMRTADLQAVYDKLTFNGYQLEMAVNHYFQKRGKRCYWLQTALKNTYKINKWKLDDSWESYRQEIVGFVKYDGAKTYVKQVAEFCYDSIETLE